MLIQAIRTPVPQIPPDLERPERSYNKIGLGFWRVPDLGYTGSAAVTLEMLRVSTGAAGSAAVTLRMLTDSAVGNLSYPGSGAVSLKALTVWAEARYGPDDNPGRVTLKALTASATGTVLAPLAITHSLFYKYNARSGGPVATWIKSYQGSRQLQIKRTVPAQTSDQEFDVGIAEASTLALTLYADQDVIVELNAGHTQRIVLPAQEPIIWTLDSGDAFPFTSDVTALVVSNQGLIDADFTIVALIQDASN